MEEKEMMEIMRQDIVVPDIVQQRAKEAFRKIEKENSKVVRLHTNRRKWKTMWIAVAAVVLALGTTVCAAAYLRWSKGLQAEFQMTPKEKQLLEDKNYMSPILDDAEETAQSGSAVKGVTDGGVTVTPLEMIVDDRFAWLSFRVEGYELEEGKEPWFDVASLEIDNDAEANISYFSSFFDGLYYDGRDFFYEDGTSAKDADGNLMMKYVDENGYMEYIIQINGTHYDKGMVGSSLHVTFQDLGTIYKAEFSPDLEAKWEFDIELKGSDEVRKVSLSESLGDSGATVTYAEISPISLYVQYDFPLKTEAVEAVGENGESIATTDFVEAPALNGVRLKDGTFLPFIIDGGTQGYLDGEQTVYTASFATSRVLDTSQVDALLFLKGSPETRYNGEDEWIEENMYIVPIE